MRSIRHLRVGYLLIDVSPILSVFLMALPYASAGQTNNIFLFEMPYIVWHTSVVAVVVVGLALFGYGYVKRQMRDEGLKMILIVNVLLVLWGVFVLWSASAWYKDMVNWFADPGRRAPQIWDYLEYWTWGLKAVLWIGAGLLLTVTSLKEIVTRRRGSGR